MKIIIGNILGWPSDLAELAPFWPLVGALLCRWTHASKLEARCVGIAIARSIALARQPDEE